jgi:hypothetical protein
MRNIIKTRYVTTTNAMIAGTDMEGADVVTILRKAYGKTTIRKLSIHRQDFLLNAALAKRPHDI